MREQDHTQTLGEKTRCGITGSSGYVGSRIAAALLSNFEVIPMGRSVSEPGIRWTMESVSVEEELCAARVTALVHCAWDFSHPIARDNWEVNVEGTRRLLEGAVSAGVTRFVFVSSLSAFEEARSEYGKSKLAVERIVLEMGGTVIRPGLVWGDRPGGVFGALKKQVSKGWLVPMIGNGRYPQFLVHEDDLAEAVRRAVSAPLPNVFAGRVLTLAHPRSWLLRDLILGMANKEGKRIKLLGVPWRLVYLALKTAEAVRVNIGFRSDSLLGLVYQSEHPVLSQEIFLRPFTMKDIA